MKHFIFSASVAVAGLSVMPSMAGVTSVPSDLEVIEFAGSDKVPSPAVLCASASGEVFVGVDMQGSLGKNPNKGKIIKLVDTDNDGKADKVSEYAKIDNPRGLISLGDKLYCLHCVQDEDGTIGTQQLSVYTDADGDGVADGTAKPLVTNIGNAKFIKSRGVDHSTNNIRLAIDGWIYISVGDFGFVGAEGTDGTKLSMHGGGIVRVRPDGSELETFIHGTRNVYDVAIDPFMNVFTRENTNDGVGWWIRFSHYIQSGEYGYPSLYTNFPEDMIPALGEYGSGSGSGNLFFQEPGWPEKYNNTAMMADWGRSQIFIHRLEKDGASFTNVPENFIGSSQAADLDVDGSGRLYVAAWDGAGYKGNPAKGFVSMVVPKEGWEFKAFPDLKGLGADELVRMLNSESATTRVAVQQEILGRNDEAMASGLVTLAQDKGVLLEGRVAAIYTLAQLSGEAAMGSLTELAKDEDLSEHAIRCMADRKSVAKKASVALLTEALNDKNPRVQVAAAVALGRVGDVSAADALIVKAVPPVMEKVEVEEIEKSKIITGKETVSIEKDITGFSELHLIVNEEGDIGSDHAVWMNPTVTLADGTSLDLTKRKWKKATQGWGKSRVNQTCVGKPLVDHSGHSVSGIGTHAKSVIIYKIPKNAVKFTATGMLSNPNGKVSYSVSNKTESKPKIHSTPNPAILLPHIARQAVIALGAEDACIVALNSSNEEMRSGALASMKFMHSEKVVDALLAAAQKAEGDWKERLTNTLIRLHQKEVEYDGSTWWSTRPDPTGPYFYPTAWSGTDKISGYLTTLYASLDEAGKVKLKKEIVRNRAYIDGLNPRPAAAKGNIPTLEKTGIEDIIIYVGKHKGNAKKGQKIIGKVGCVGCHNVKAGDVVKAPDLAKLGKMSRADIAEAIHKPSASIAKSWVNVTMEDGMAHLGTVVKQDEKEILLHNIGGVATKLDATKVKKIEPGMGMMSEHLCNELTLAEFSDLIAYLQSMDPDFKPKK